tara:strand:+ start:3063 stop:3242 length:180 start_codon:yes stop_codon:yes gene_type:complete
LAKIKAEIVPLELLFMLTGYAKPSFIQIVSRRPNDNVALNNLHFFGLGRRFDKFESFDF